MASLNELEDALRNAHAAGDTAAANKLADAIVAQKGESVIDWRSGAPKSTRLAVGAVPEKNRLETIRKIHPDAEPFQNGNFLFTSPETGLSTVYNPSGPDWGDIVAGLPEVGEIIGGSIGAGVGAVAGLPAGLGGVATGGVAGGGLGAAAG